MYSIVFTTQTVKDAKKIKNSYLFNKTNNLLEIMRRNPYEFPPEYEFLHVLGDNIISRRINKQHRLVYQVLENEQIIKILRMWTHYE